MLNAFKRSFVLIFVLFVISADLMAAQFLLQKGNLFREDRIINLELDTISELQVVFNALPQGWKIPKDISEIVKDNLRIIQNDRKIKLTDIKSFTDYFQISFSRDQLEIYQDFEFNNSENTLAFSIAEKNWPGYEKYYTLYNDAIQKSIEMNYPAAFDLLTAFLADNDEINPFSFTSKARAKAEECLENYFKSKNIYLDTHQLKHSKDLTQKAIAEIDSVIAEISDNNELFAAYYSYLPGSELEKNNQQTIADYQEYLTNLKIRYFDEIQQLFIENDYNNYKFKLMLDLLVRSICYKDSLSLISSYNLASLDYLNSKPELKDKLVNLEWFTDFERLIRAVNINLENDDYYLKPASIESLKNKDINSPQPYYQILQALQNALIENWTDFSIDINNAIERCSDPELLFLLERMKIAYMAEVIVNLDEKVIVEINSGIEYLQNKDYENARNAFQKAKNWQSDFAFCDYMLGKLSVTTGEFVKAEIYLDNAIQKQPQYLEPVYTKLDLLIKNGRYQDALNLLNVSIHNNSWYKYYLLGKLHLNQNENNKAREYFEKALEINAANFDLLIELGDTYKNLNNKNKAEEFYRQAGFLDPENDVFMNRLNLLKTN